MNRFNGRHTSYKCKFKQLKQIGNHGTVNSTIGMKINATIYPSVIATKPAKLVGDVVW
jgi:hypothetical protein